MRKLGRFVTAFAGFPTPSSASLARVHQFLTFSRLARHGPAFRRGYLTFAVLAFWLTTGSGVVMAATYFVNASTGSNANNGLASGTAFQTITYAISQAANSDVINVAAGTYNEYVTVSKSLTILGANAGISGTGVRVAESIIDGQTLRDGFNITAINVVVDGFRVINGGGNNLGGIGFTLAGVSSVTVTNNIISNNVIGLTTVYNTTQTNVLIKNNLFDGNNAAGPASGFGIYIQSGGTNTGLTVQGNVFRNQAGNLLLLENLPSTYPNFVFSENNIETSNSTTGSKVYLTAVSNATISRNTFAALGGSRSLKLAGANSGVTVSNNFISFTSTQAGITISNDGGGPNAGLVINNNSFVGSAGTAIQNQEATLVNGMCNWFGVSSNVSPFISGPVTFTPFLTDGTDNDSPTPGFQPAPNNCNGCPGGVLVTNINTGIAYCSIQSAIDDANTVNGHTIQVGAGTYAETVMVNKSLTINAPNSAISPNTGVRVAEAIITGGLNVDNAASKTLVVSGFSFSAVSSPFNYNGNAAGTINADLTFSKNIVRASSGQLAVFTGTVSNTATIVVNDSRFLTMTTNAMQLGGGNVIAQITQNVIDGTVNAGINTDGIINSSISSNTITNTAQQGIQVSGASGNVTVSQNVISNANTGNTANRGAIRFSGAALVGALNITNNAVSSSNNGIVIPAGDITGKTILVNNNSLTGITGLAIKHLGTGTLNAECNWYGTVSNINTLVSGPVTFTPFLTNGTDNAPGTAGFQPVPNSCACPAPTVSLSPASTLVCTGTLVTLTATPGTAGSYTYTFSAGATQGGGGLTDNTATVNASGTYSVTITNANGCTAVSSNTSSVTVSSPAPIMFTNPAASSVVCEGSTVIVPVTVTGSPTGFQWFKDGLSVPGQTSATLTLGGVTPAQAGSYSLVITAACNSSTTSGFVLTVNPAPTVTITVPSGSTVVGPGTGTATITVPDPLTGVVFQAFGGVFYEQVIILDRINGYEIRQVNTNDTGIFPINQAGPFRLTVTGANGCKRTVEGIIVVAP